MEISISNGEAYIWNANGELTSLSFILNNISDAVALRRDHRILGYFQSTHPAFPSQNDNLVLPMHLTKQQATYLLENGLVVVGVVDCKALLAFETMRWLTLVSLLQMR